MAYKLLISGESGSGKTTLTKNMKDTLVISHDGKMYPYKIPHATIDTFSSAEELINFIEDKAIAYKERFGDFPKTMVFDSVSRIFETLDTACNKRYTGYQVYNQLNNNISEFAAFLEKLVENGINVVIISHAIYDADSSRYNLVGKGSFSKLGGFYSVVDEAVFIETKNSKRHLHFRSVKFPARTMNDDFPDSVEIDKFDLDAHIQSLTSAANAASEFRL